MKTILRIALLVTLVSLVACNVSPTATPTVSVLPTPAVSSLTTPEAANRVVGPRDAVPDKPAIDLQVVLDFLVANQEIIALAAAFALSMFSRGMKGLEATGSQLMLSIETLAKDQVLADGVDKMTETVSSVMDKIPLTLKPILATYAILRGKMLDQLIREMCQKWYDKAVK